MPKLREKSFKIRIIFQSDSFTKIGKNNIEFPSFYKYFQSVSSVTLRKEKNTA